MTTTNPNDELAEVFPPGEFISDELEARGWEQLDLAQITGRTPAAINEIVTGKRAVTPEMAHALEQALGVSAQFWMNVETRWRLSQTKTEDRTIERRARLYSKAPIKEMVKRKWIEGSSNIEVVERQVVDFFEADTLDSDFVLPHAARKANYDETTPAQCAWLYRTRQLARLVEIKTKWKSNRQKELVKKLRELSLDAVAIQYVPRVLSDFGIRFVAVEPLPQAKIAGACFRLNGNPVIAHALRYDRIDNFWHTLMHEVAHILNGDELAIDEEVLSGEGKPDSETRADSFAVESLVSQSALDDFCLRWGPKFSHTQLRAFAARMKVHPGIVAGQLHYRGPENGGAEYSHFRRLLVPIRKTVRASALCDGWGEPVVL